MRIALRIAFIWPMFLISNVFAASYPDKPIRVVVPYAPGGATDTISRILTQKLSESMGQPVVVDNRPGAGGIIGTGIVARAVPDGYTVLTTALPHVVNPSLQAKVIPFNTARDFTPVVKFISYSSILVVNSSLPVNSVSDLIELARREPGRLNYGASNGTMQHLSGALFNNMGKVDMRFIPFKIGNQAMTSLLAGDIQVIFEGAVRALPFIKSGRVKALAVTSSDRSPFAPDLPTIAETGLPGYEVSSWVGMLLPSGAPAAIVSRLNAESNRLLQLDEVKKQIAKFGAVPAGGTPEQFGSYLKEELVKWAAVVKQANIKAE